MKLVILVKVIKKIQLVIHNLKLDIASDEIIERIFRQIPNVKSYCFRRTRKHH